MSELPTDAEFLRFIYESEKDSVYIAQMRANHDAFNSRRAYEVAVAIGVSEEDEEGYHRRQKDLLPAEAFQGRTASHIREAVFQILGEDSMAVEHVPVGLLATKHLNGCAIRTPRGGSIILLDHGTMIQLVLIVRCALAYMTYHSEQPYCRDAPQSDYGGAIIDLALYNATGNYGYFARNRSTYAFPSLGYRESLTAITAACAEWFILLHEYGHVVCGHLSGATAVSITVGNDVAVEELNCDERAELEADHYAITKLLAGVKNVFAFGPPDVAFAVGLMLKYFEVCERVTERLTGQRTSAQRTHPPPQQRWELIKTATALESYPAAHLAHLIDPAFQTILDEITVMRW